MTDPCHKRKIDDILRDILLLGREVTLDNLPFLLCVACSCELLGSAVVCCLDICPFHFQIVSNNLTLKPLGSMAIKLPRVLLA